VSKERARRRAQREREAAVLAAARAAEAERKERRDARVRVVASRLPQRSPQRRRGPSGVLAERRRRQTSLLVVAVVALNVLVWLASGDWAVRALAVLLSVLLAPLAHILMTSRP
jgi:hypothetical protein